MLDKERYGAAMHVMVLQELSSMHGISRPVVHILDRCD